MKKAFIILLSLGLLFSAFSVYASPPPQAADCGVYCDAPEDWEMPSSTVCYCNPLGEDTELTSITEPIINFIFRLSIVVVPVLVLWGAFLIVTAGGEMERVNEGKQVIFWTLIGFLIVLLSRGLGDLLEGFLGI